MATAPSGAIEGVGRTWPDVIHETMAHSVWLPVSFTVLFIFFVATLFTIFAYRRAMLEKRTFKAFGGFLFESGAPSEAKAEADPVHTEQPSEASLSGRYSSPFLLKEAAAGALYRGTIAVARASLEIAVAEDDARAAEREGYLLTALVNSTKHVDGNERRASILRVVAGSDGDDWMEVAVGFPDVLFAKPAVRFSRRAFQKTGGGLCWAAVHACMGGHAAHSIKRNVFHAVDVTKEPSFVSFSGHHTFQSILIAPVIIGDRVLGAICLDSEQPSHYEEADQTLLASAALALATAWHSRQKGRSLASAVAK